MRSVYLLQIGVTWAVEQVVDDLWGNSADKVKFGAMGLYGLSVGIQWLRLVSFLLVQRELGQVNSEGWLGTS